jgi:hypothetical protein
VTAAVEMGLERMGYASDEPYEWVKTDTYQLINHGVSPKSDALRCEDCHLNPDRLDFAALGYSLKEARDTLCVQCHGDKGDKPFEALHKKHVADKGYDCLNCHTFSRPEKGLKMP